MLEFFTKQDLIEKLRAIRDQGWIPNARPGNQGGIGNTLEDLLGIEENNLPIPNAAEWELKTQRLSSGSMTTLFHMEPSPRAMRFVPRVLLPSYGWAHAEAGGKYSADERSFRQTISATRRTDRGFRILIDRQERRVVVSFNARSVDTYRHGKWLSEVEAAIGLGELEPQPYWGFDDLFHKAGTKLANCFYVQAARKKIGGIEHYHYQQIHMLERFSLDALIASIEQGMMLVDFDARTGHNHGTKFRIKQGDITHLYANVTEL